jgi:ATP-dependent exoDNAse (exonuclease V) beta subunit
VEHGQVAVFVAVDHASAECVGIHAALHGTRHEALEPVRQGVAERFGSVEKNAAEGATSTSEEIEEERRLLCVAMTRAKDDLQLITPLRLFFRGNPSRGDGYAHAARSRFLPEHVLDRFERRRLASAHPSPARASALPMRDLAGRMRGMWGK